MKKIQKILVLLLTVLLSFFAITNCQNTSSGTVSGTLETWNKVTVDFEGPQASESDNNPNPFLDYSLEVEFNGPNGNTYLVPGFFAGDGNGGGSGNIWRVRFI